MEWGEVHQTSFSSHWLVQLQLRHYGVQIHRRLRWKSIHDHDRFQVKNIEIKNKEWKSQKKNKKSKRWNQRFQGHLEVPKTRLFWFVRALAQYSCSIRTLIIKSRRRNQRLDRRKKWILHRNLASWNSELRIMEFGTHTLSRQTSALLNKIV